MYYSFYLDKEKTKLVYRIEQKTAETDDGETIELTKIYSESVGGLFDMSIAKQFLTEDECKKDFYKILFDNEDFRWGGVHGNEKVKPVKQKAIKEKKAEIEKLKVEIYNEEPKVIVPKIVYTDIPQRNKVYNEDCLLTMGRMPDGYVDHIITSPPYNAGTRVSCGKNNAIYIGDENMYSDGYEDKLSDQEYEDWLFEVIRECIRVTKYHVFFNIQMLTKNKRTVLKIHGEFVNQIKDKLIWNKSIAAPHIVPGIMRSKYEDIFIFSNQNPESRDFKDGEFSGSFSNVLDGMNASGNKFRKLNKATFPLYLPRTILNHWGEKGQLIYDPFNGTGTTGDACVIEKRDYIGSELDPLQCEVTNRRITDRSAAQEFDFG